MFSLRFLNVIAFILDLPVSVIAVSPEKEEKIGEGVRSEGQGRQRWRREISEHGRTGAKGFPLAERFPLYPPTVSCYIWSFIYHGIMWSCTGRARGSDRCI